MDRTYFMETLNTYFCFLWKLRKLSVSESGVGDVPFKVFYLNVVKLHLLLILNHLGLQLGEGCFEFLIRGRHYKRRL